MNSVRFRVFGCAAVLATMLGSITVPTAMADPTRVDNLITEMDNISRQTEAKAEEVKQIEIDLKAKEENIGHLREEQAKAAETAEQAKNVANGTQMEVNRIAGSKYRGTTIDPITTVISANNPQSAIDRSAYMSSLAKRTETIAEEYRTASDDAATAHNQAIQNADQADFELGELRKHRDELAKQQDELKGQMDGLRQQVDKLGEQDRRRWVEKNGPVNFNLAGVTGSPAGMGAVQAALSKVGAPYSWGAAGPNEFDCSGLIYWAYQQQGKTLPRTSQAQLSSGTPVSKDNLQPGDVIGYYPGVTHVGMYVGNGMVVHASDYGIPVQVVSVDSMPYNGARRY